MNRSAASEVVRQIRLRLEEAAALADGPRRHAGRALVAELQRGRGRRDGSGEGEGAARLGDEGGGRRGGLLVRKLEGEREDRVGLVEGPKESNG